jgi:hypothetical protein
VPRASRRRDETWHIKAPGRHALSHYLAKLAAGCRHGQLQDFILSFFPTEHETPAEAVEPRVIGPVSYLASDDGDTLAKLVLNLESGSQH